MVLNKEDSDKVRIIKSGILSMIDERNSIKEADNNFISASAYWASFCEKFQYLFGLSEEYFGQLRLHTYHLDGDNYQTYFFKRNINADRKLWENLTAGLPKERILSAPLILEEPGYDFDGKIISTTVLNCQHAINTLFAEGIIDRLSRVPGKVTVLEIGGGYGALVYHLDRFIKNAAYIIVDLPETLLFSAVYLSLCFPRKSVYFYNRATIAQAVSNNFAGYDIVLLPNYILEQLQNMKFDLVTNMQSFQEMRPKQLDAYLEFIAKTLRGELYSWNNDANPQNKEGVHVTTQLKNKFRLKAITWAPPKLSIFSRLQDISLRKILNRFHKVVTTGSAFGLKEYICVKNQ